MKPTFYLIGTGLLLTAACSLINAPEELEAVAGGGGSAGAEGAEGGAAGAAQAGSQNRAGEAPAEAGTGGCGDSCSEGGAPPIGRACEVSGDDCGSTAPICDSAAGECRACQSNQECADELGRGFCLSTGQNAGRCAECKRDSDCDASDPVCGTNGLCRGCEADAECSSGACGDGGKCVPTEAIVYALAETGSNTPCGTAEAPCRNLSDATQLLSALRPTLLLQKTTVPFTTGNATFPSVQGLRVIGNGNKVRPNDGKTSFIVPAGAEVTFEGIVIAGSSEQDMAGIRCQDATLTVIGSILQDNATGIQATNCELTVDQSVLQHNANPLVYSTAAIDASCSTESCPLATRVTRSRFIDNGVAVYFANQAEAVLENNLFLRNGYDGYTRVLELRSDVTQLRYNTLVENFNGCTYVGIVACVGTCSAVGNISFNNFPGADCQDQVWYQTTLSYSLTEIAYPGTTNAIGDPKFVDAAAQDFTPGADSPALDAGDPSDAPATDIDGNPRPSGAADIGAFEAQ